MKTKETYFMPPAVSRSSNKRFGSCNSHSLHDSFSMVIKPTAQTQNMYSQMMQPQVQTHNRLKQMMELLERQLRLLKSVMRSTPTANVYSYPPRPCVHMKKMKMGYRNSFGAQSLQARRLKNVKSPEYLR